MAVTAVVSLVRHINQRTPGCGMLFWECGRWFMLIMHRCCQNSNTVNHKRWLGRAGLSSQTCHCGMTMPQWQMQVLDMPLCMTNQRRSRPLDAMRAVRWSSAPLLFVTKETYWQCESLAGAHVDGAPIPVTRPTGSRVREIPLVVGHTALWQSTEFLALPAPVIGVAGRRQLVPLFKFSFVIGSVVLTGASSKWARYFARRRWPWRSCTCRRTLPTRVSASWESWWVKVSNVFDRW